MKQKKDEYLDLKYGVRGFLISIYDTLEISLFNELFETAYTNTLIAVEDKIDQARTPGEKFNYVKMATKRNFSKEYKKYREENKRYPLLTEAHSAIEDNSPLEPDFEINYPLFLSMEVQKFGLFKKEDFDSEDMMKKASKHFNEILPLIKRSYWTSDIKISSALLKHQYYLSPETHQNIDINRNKEIAEIFRIRSWVNNSLQI